MPADASIPWPRDEAACQRFLEGWRTGQPQPLEQLLPLPEQPTYLGTLFRLVQIDLAARWQLHAQSVARAAHGTIAYPARLETYLERFPLLREAKALEALARLEYQLRHQYGDQPDAADYHQRFPQLVGKFGSIPPTTAIKAPTTPAPSWPHIEGYQIRRELGKGGMGVVYEAVELRLQRVVALKVISTAGALHESFRQRFITEARAIAQLQHPNIVQIFEVGEQDGIPFMALELVGGGSLRDKLQGRPLPPRQAAALLHPLAIAMHHAHQKGIVHRDLKPGNILLTPGKIEPKVTDFGLAKLLDSGDELSHSGDILGTPAYMAPEQADGRIRDICPQTDVYGLGAVLYSLLTGRPPFKGDTHSEVCRQVREQEPRKPSELQANVPKDLDTIALKCLHKDPRDRYASAYALAEDLQRFLNDEPIRARPTTTIERGWRWMRRNRKLALASAAAAVLAGAALWFGWQALDLAGRQGELISKADEATKGHQQLEREKDKAVGEKDKAVGEKVEALGKKEKAERDKLNEALQHNHAYADLLLRKAADRQETQESALEAVRAALPLEGAGHKHLEALGSPATETADFARRWQERKIGLRNAATWRLSQSGLQLRKTVRLPDSEGYQNFAVAVDAAGRRAVVVPSTAKEGFLIDIRQGSFDRFPIPISPLAPERRGGYGPTLALSPDGAPGVATVWKRAHHPAGCQHWAGVRPDPLAPRSAATTPGSLAVRPPRSTRTAPAGAGPRPRLGTAGQQLAERRTPQAATARLSAAGGLDPREDDGRRTGSAPPGGDCAATCRRIGTNRLASGRAVNGRCARRQACGSEDFLQGRTGTILEIRRQ